MKLDVINLEGTVPVPSIVDEALFGSLSRAPTSARVVRWRVTTLSRTHKVKTFDKTSYSLPRRSIRQKGYGGARHGDRNAPIFRPRWVTKGPTASAATATS